MRRATKSARRRGFWNQPQDAAGKTQEIRAEVKIRLLMLGKTRRAELRGVLDEYVKRVSRYSPTEIVEVRDGAAMLKKLDADRAATVVLLDAGGKALSSEEFAKWLGKLRDRGTRELFFVC